MGRGIAASVEVVQTARLQFVRIEHIDRGGRFVRQPRGAARADDDDRIVRLHLFLRYRRRGQHDRRRQTGPPHRHLIPPNVSGRL